MTIKPKKKALKEKNEAESSEAPLVGLPHYHSTPESRVRSSPPRWLPSTSREEATASPNYEYEDPSTSSTHKRRHCSSPHRTTRKHRSNHATPAVNVVNTGPTGGASPLPLSEPHNEEEYNSEEEHFAKAPTTHNLAELEQWFEATLKEKKGFIIKKMGEDGACLFRAVADQVYGDQEMHAVVRKHCLDYMAKNADFYSQYVTEDFPSYVNRKRIDSCHGNHLEIQAMSELFNRPVQVYQYSIDPMNTFDTAYKTDNPPIRLSYHNNVHYNSIVDPYTATIGVGLGLPEMQPGAADRNLMKDAIKSSENFHIEQAMLEDKLRETDWEVTQDSIEEQVARESYLQWLREQEKASHRTKGLTRSASATCSSSDVNNPLEAGRSPRQHRNASPLQQAASQEEYTMPGSSKSPRHSPAQTPSGAETDSSSLAAHLPTHLYGMSEWSEEEILAQVIAQSQQEYLDQLKQKAFTSSPSPPHYGAAGPSPFTGAKGKKHS